MTPSKAVVAVPLPRVWSSTGRLLQGFRLEQTAPCLHAIPITDYVFTGLPARHSVSPCGSSPPADKLSVAQCSQV